MITEPDIGMRIRFRRTDSLPSSLNDQTGTITALAPWGNHIPGVVTVQFDSMDSHVCSLCFLFSLDDKEAESQQRRAHAMKFL